MDNKAYSLAKCAGKMHRQQSRWSCLRCVQVTFSHHGEQEHRNKKELSNCDEEKGSSFDYQTNFFDEEFCKIKKISSRILSKKIYKLVIL